MRPNQLSAELTVEESRVFAATGKLPARLTDAPAPVTSPPPDKLEAAAEKTLHTQIIQELNRRGIKFVHAAMNKRSTLPEGHPDFAVYLPGGVLMFAEIKAAHGKLSAIQERYIGELAADGFRTEIIRTFDEFILMLRTFCPRSIQPS